MVRAVQSASAEQVSRDSKAPAPALGVKEPPFALILALFVLSGATGLVDQLCFSKYLSYVVGSTAHAVSAVLSAFMTGLALGAFLGGRYARSVKRPLVAYGVLELVVGVTVALSPAAFQALAPLYAAIARSAPGSLVALSAARWLGALRERRLGALYASNTAGGALGALLAAYAILPLLGMSATVLASAFGSACIGTLAIAFGRRAPSTLPAASANISGVHNAKGVVHDAFTAYAVAVASGALVFAAEVIFTHLLALIIGNSAYAFGLILAAFLSCLFLGASRAAAVRARFGEAALPFGLILTGLALVITLPLWDKLPLVFNNTGQYFTSFAAREATRGGIAFIVLAIPTVFMGLTFPLLLQRVAGSDDLGWWVGRLTTVNTLGAVFGSLFTGYVLLPALGSERSLFAVALAFVATGLLTTRFIAGRARSVAFLLSAGSALIWLVAPRWDLARLTAGTNVYFEGWDKPEEVPFVRDDIHGGVTTVTKLRGVYTLYTNGKFQGNTGWEMHAQRFFAHYPSIFVSRFERALIIGLGTGTTLGTIASYPWQKLDLVEISPAIVEAADQYFRSVNNGAIHDPRLTLHLGDGRNFLLVEQRRYDLISMELSSIWFAGAASLYSEEFYQLVQQHLAERGIFQQWVQLHHVRRKDFATIVHTLRTVFPHVALFYGGGQGILVASMQPLAASTARVEELQAHPSVLANTPGERPLMTLLDDILVADADLDRFLEDSADEAGQPLNELVSTDGNLYLEYATPRGNVLPWSAREELVRKISEFKTDVSMSSLRVE